MFFETFSETSENTHYLSPFLTLLYFFDSNIYIASNPSSVHPEE